MARRESRLSTRRTSRARPRITSGIVGGILLVFAALWIAWLLLHQFGGPALPALPIIGFAPTVQPATQIAPLVAEGITLGHADQTPALNQQQALLIASQLEPDAATRAKSATAQYVLVNYPNKSTPAAHANLDGVPVWLIYYQKIPLEAADASVDPTPSPHAYYDLYVFLDANSGKELLAIQV